MQILQLHGESIFVNGNDLLAFEPSLTWDIKMMRKLSAMLAGGLFNVKLEGHGMLAITSHHEPLTLLVEPGRPVRTDPNATIAWSGTLQPEFRTDISLKTFFGRGSGESIQMEFNGQGFVVIQPYEERFVQAGAGRRITPMPRITQSDLQAYLDEALAPAEMATVEAELRLKPELLQQLAAINSRRDAGVHSVGEIWRRHRLSCPSREHLGSYLLAALDEDHAGYIEFHLQTIGCRFCQANLEDLRRQQQESSEVVQSRRTKYFQSTAGHLRKKR